jgi:carboxyl-terminal processing protease
MFSENTYDEFKTALQDLIKKGINNLIIDVRDNPGGYMDAVANIADEMISGDHTIIQTKGKNREDELRTHIDGQFENGKVVILVNENSASASEILAGVIQDLDRGIVVGRRTYGKGLVQEQFVLPDRSAIRITTARYYLPSGRCIQRSYKNGKANYKKDIFNRFEHGELTNSDSTNHTNLQDTFYTTSKKIVFGNEGITPNYFVSLDTSQAQSLNSFYETHLASGFTSSYYYANKNEFNTYTTAEVFAKDFALTHKQLDALKLYVHSLGFSNSMSNFYLNSSKIQSIIKAEFAKLQFGYNGYFASLAQQDEMILKAISLLAQ